MREILFRGKEPQGDWCYGGLIQSANDFYISIGINKGFMCAFVKPETIGQYTGLTDKNGKKIFEGDIVQYLTYDYFDCKSIVKFGKYEQDGSDGEYDPSECLGFYAEVDNFICPDWFDNDPTRFQDHLKQQSLAEIASQCVVIGNIHDNPELLEV